MLLPTLATLALLAAQPAGQPPAARHDDLGAALVAELRTLPAKRAALGDAESRAGLVRAEAWVQERLTAAGLKATTHEFVWASPALKAAVLGKEAHDPPGDDPRFRFRNLIVDLPGTDLAREVLLVGAHYDAVPDAPGADDNGSGVVGLLEIGRRLKTTPHRRSIRLVFFTLEEVGLVGSREYLKDKRPDWTPTPAREGAPAEAAKEKLAGMVSLECIGFFSDAEGSQISPIPKIAGKPVVDLKIPSAGNFIGMAGVARHRAFSQGLLAEMQKAEPSLPVLAADMLPIAPPDFLRSDHAPFLLAGYPAVLLTDTANFRNPNYHKPTDDPATLDPARWARVVRAVAAAIAALADAPPTPTPPSTPTPDPTAEPAAPAPAAK